MSTYIYEEQIDDMEFFVIKQDGFSSNNKHVRMDLRLLDGKSEGEGLAIAFSDTVFEDRGDYLPLELDKEQTKQLIDKLTELYKKL